MVNPASTNIGDYEQAYWDAIAKIQDARDEAARSMKSLNEQKKDTAYLHKKIYDLLQDLNADSSSSGEEDINARHSHYELETDLTEQVNAVNMAIEDDRERLARLFIELEQKEEMITNEFKKKLNQGGDPS